MPQLSSAPERVHRGLRRRPQRRGAGAARKSRQHQQRHAESSPGCRKVGDVFRAELDGLGFKTRWVDGEAFHRAGHLVADHPAAGPALSPDRAPRHRLRTGQSLPDVSADSTNAPRRGPGVIDMKGGDVIIVQALKALARRRPCSKTLNVIVVMTGDEEDSGDPQSLARAALVEAAKGADYALGFEDGPGDPRYAVTARRGTSSWTLNVKGFPAHSSQIFRPDVGYGAIYEAAQNSRRLPPEARRPGAPDVQSWRDARRDVDRFRRDPEPRHGVWQGERRRRARHGDGRPAHPVEGRSSQSRAPGHAVGRRRTRCRGPRRR